MHVPDGFGNTKRTTGNAGPAPKFTSAFSDPKKSKLTPKGVPLRAPPLIVKPPTTTVQIEQLKQPRARPAPQPDPEQPQAGPSRLPPTAITAKEKQYPGVKPRTFALDMGPTTKFTLKPHISGLSPQKDMSSPVRAKKVMSIQQIQPKLPAPPQPDPTKPMRTLKELQPPPPPPPRVGPPIPVGRKLKTLSTTRLALMLDPQTESGMEELMALHMGQNASTYVTPAQRELNRGLGQSPEKASKKKKAKFIRCVPHPPFYSFTPQRHRSPGADSPSAPNTSFRDRTLGSPSGRKTWHFKSNAPRPIRPSHLISPSAFSTWSMFRLSLACSARRASRECLSPVVRRYTRAVPPEVLLSFSTSAH